MVYSKLSFGIINEHLFSPFMCRIFQTVKSLNILSLMAILEFRLYISHKKEMKVKIMTQDYVQNLINPLVVLKFDPKEPKLFEYSQKLLKIS